MPASSQGRLNQLPNLRYDHGHEVSTAEENPPSESTEAREEGGNLMDVSGPSSVGSIGGATPLGKRQADPVPPKSSEIKPAEVRDEVEISEASRALDDLSRTSEVRAERLARIKAAIADGSYDTPEKLEAALQRMMAIHDHDGDAS